MPRAHTHSTTTRAAGEKGGGTDDNGRMHVPTDAFGGMSPEYKAASALKNLFTMVAVRVVLAQEQGYDNEGGAMTETYRGLQDYLAANPLRDGNKWLEQLMRHEDNNMRLTALRLLEVRKAYAGGQFDFKGMHELAVEVGVVNGVAFYSRATAAFHLALLSSSTFPLWSLHTLSVSLSHSLCVSIECVFSIVILAPLDGGAHQGER